jgi:hypothetical protein
VRERVLVGGARASAALTRRRRGRLIQVSDILAFYNSTTSTQFGSRSTTVAKLGILPKKRVDLFSTSPSSAPTLANHDDPNPSLPNAKGPESLVSKIPPTPPAENPYKLEDSDDELEYTRRVPVDSTPLCMVNC